MKYWTISDTHFQNENIIKYCDRPFKDASQQTEALIERWNMNVAPEDVVIVCGDFIMGSPDGMRDILEQLNGSIILVRGNHDTDRKIEMYNDLFSRKVIRVVDTYYFQYQGYFFVFCHFPLVNHDYGQMVSRRHKDVVYVHGHVHDSMPFMSEEMHAFNVSADVVNFTPVPMSRLADIANTWKGRRDG